MQNLNKAKVFDRIIDPKLGAIIHHEETEQMQKVMDAIFNRPVPDFLPDSAKDDLINMAYFILKQTAGFRDVINEVVGTPQEEIMVKGYIGTNMNLCKEFSRRFQEQHPDLMDMDDEE